MTETGGSDLDPRWEFTALLIGGERVAPVVDHGILPVVDPATDQPIGTIPVAGTADVDLAVAAANRAWNQWADSDPELRSRLLAEVARRIRAGEDDFAEAIRAEMGAPIDNARDVQTALAADVFESYARLILEFDWQETRGRSTVLYEPIGVIAAITPWNYPMYLAAIKIAAALAAGCTVVFKPSADAPLDAFLLVELIEKCAKELGAPPGLVNLLTGDGRVIGGALSSHPGIAAVSFTGSTGAGQQVLVSAASTIKRVGLELGGKSAAIVAADVADLPAVLARALADVFYNSGQTCTACARILIPASRYPEAVDLARTIASQWTLGDPRSAGDHIGPIATRRQYETVLGYIDGAIGEGAELVAGGRPDGAHVPVGLEAGYWVLPTVFANVGEQMTIAREEIFGPVAVLMAYRDDDDAIRIANDSIYGLSGAVWSADPAHARALAARMRTGRVVINGGPFNVEAPTGGYKQSGNGRELGVHGLHEYLEVKALQA